MSKKDLTGMEFTYFKVIGKDIERSDNKHVYWKCKCICEKEFSEQRTAIEKGLRKSCGCQKSKLISQKTLIDLQGQRFGKLFVLERDKEAEKNHPKSKQTFWKCQCDCGNIISIEKGKLTSKGQSSCGCLKSIGELHINQILSTNNISYISQYTNELLKSDKEGYYKFDFALLDDNNNIIRLIEFDGIQHTINNNYFKDDTIQKRDNIKNKYAKDNNIPLVRIPYYKRDNITLEDLLTDKYLV